MILLIAFGKRGYGLMAHNLALSLRAKSDVPIHLYITDELRQYIDASMFASINRLTDEDYKVRGRVEPAKVKSRIYELGRKIGLEKFLYLDVDGLCLNPIDFDELEGTTIATEIIGKGTKSESINYSIWASNEDIWREFNLKEDAILCGIQSSWMYFEKSQVCDKMQEYLNYYMTKGLPRSMVSNLWGGAIPDELLYQGVFAKMGIVPNTVKGMIFFGHKKALDTPADVAEKYRILSLYGNGDGNTLTRPKWFKLYDSELRKLGGHYYPHDKVMRDKHVNRA